jgi:uncharacterized protein YktA (UPF0223 family)
LETQIRIKHFISSDQSNYNSADLSWVEKGARVLHSFYGQGVIRETMMDDKNNLKAIIKFKDGEKTFIVRIVVNNGLLKKI